MAHLRCLLTTTRLLPVALLILPLRAAWAGPDLPVRGVVAPPKPLEGVRRVTFGTASGPQAAAVMAAFKDALLDPERGAKGGFTPEVGLRVDVLQPVTGGEADATLDLTLTPSQPVDVPYTDPVTRVVNGAKVEILQSCRKREVAVEARIEARRPDGAVVASQSLTNAASAKLCKDSAAELRTAIDGGLLPSIDSLVAEATAPLGAALANSIAPSWATWELELLVDKVVRDGNKLARDGEWGAAVAAWSAVVAADSYNPAARFNLGVANEVAGQFAAARDDYRKAAALKPGKAVDEALARVSAREAEVEKLVETWGMTFTPVTWEAPAQAGAKMVEVRGSKNLRVPLLPGPQAGGGAVAQLPGGVSVRLVAEEGEWVRVAAPDGVEGYLLRTQVSGL